MAEDLPNVTTVRIPLTGEPLDHTRILEKRRRERPRGHPETGDEAEEESLLDQQDDEEPHELDVNA